MIRHACDDFHYERNRGREALCGDWPLPATLSIGVRYVPWKEVLRNATVASQALAAASAW